MLSRIALILIGLVIFATPVQAGTYLGLTPGQSTKADADRVLGPPILEVEKAIQYDYEPKNHDAKRISVIYEKETRIIKTIFLYFLKSYNKKDLAAWFSLGQPVRVRTEKGRRAEYYNGIALYFSGVDDSSPVEYFSHFDLPPPVPSPASPTPEGKVATLGLLISSFDHYTEGILVWDTWPGSAAEKAGFKEGDVILQMGPHRFDRADIPIKDFVDLVRMLPTDQPTPFLVRRKSETLTIHATPEKNSLEEVKAIQQNLIRIAERHYQEGLALLERNSLAEADAHFKKAIGFDPTRSEYQIKMAETRERAGKFDSAIIFYKKAYALNHDYKLFLAIGSIYQRQGETDIAVQAYREAIRLRPKEDSSRNAEKMLEAILREKN
ncbi:MAG: tetratricopeptide repeat protein [Syntrophaceae bacterium]|nr:tetratricopeptide repeat protein [Syntrophaceae bacterium]